jgi:hypothetical protein
MSDPEIYRRELLNYLCEYTSKLGIGFALVLNGGLSTVLSGEKQECLNDVEKALESRGLGGGVTEYFPDYICIREAENYEKDSRER